MHWWARMFEDGNYRQSFKDRWTTIRQGAFKTDSILKFLNDTVAYLGAAIDRNFQRWPILGEDIWPNYYVGATHADEMNYLKTWINNRLTWLDNSINTLTNTQVCEKQKSGLSIFPNPVRNEMVIGCVIESNKKIDVEITDLSGKTIYSQSYQPSSTGEQKIHVKIPDLPQSYYFASLLQGKQKIGTIRFAVQNVK